MDKVRSIGLQLTQIDSSLLFFSTKYEGIARPPRYQIRWSLRKTSMEWWSLSNYRDSGDSILAMCSTLMRIPPYGM